MNPLEAKLDMACWVMAFALGAVIAYVNYRHRLDALDLRGDQSIPHSKDAKEVGDGNRAHSPLG